MCITIISCTTDNDKNDVKGDNYLTLKINETAVAPNSNNSLKITFKDVEDNRCPMLACEKCYGSRADVQLSVVSKGTTTDLVLPILGCLIETEDPDNIFYPEYQIDTLGYRFRMVQLSPYPDSILINKEDYIAKIKITKL